MIFSELYGAYYNTVAAVLREASSGGLSKDEIRKIIEEKAFGESVLTIEPALNEQKWQFLLPDGGCVIKHPPQMPLTLLQKRWLKAVLADPRVRLFTDEIPDMPDITPLFRRQDIMIYDKYSDGDDFEDEEYILRFRVILDAVKNSCPLSVTIKTRKGGKTSFDIMPRYLEYSEKDDKFRLICSGWRNGNVINLGRIIHCEPSQKKLSAPSGELLAERQTVEFILYDGRNALERAMLHFAHFEKQAERLDDKHYRITVAYDINDETEMVIRILSFGPMVKVTSPPSFVELIKERLIKQKNCGLSLSSD